MNRKIRSDDIDWGVVGYVLAIEIVAVGVALTIAWVMGWLI